MAFKLIPKKAPGDVHLYYEDGKVVRVIQDGTDLTKEYADQERERERELAHKRRLKK